LRQWERLPFYSAFLGIPPEQMCIYLEASLDTKENLKNWKKLICDVVVTYCPNRARLETLHALFSLRNRGLGPLRDFPKVDVAGSNPVARSKPSGPSDL